MHLMPKSIWCFAKMYLTQKCIFAYIFPWKMFSITFYCVKCYKCIWCCCVHFTVSNVTKAVQKCLFVKHSKKQKQCQNGFGAEMHFCNARSKSLDFVKNTKQRQCVHLTSKNLFGALQKCICKIWHSKMYAKIDLMQKCICNIFPWKMFSITFFKGKC